MSFLIDPPLLVGTGVAIGRLVPDGRAQRAAEAATIAGFLATSISLYLDAGWTRSLWEPTRSESGRDWMLNSRVFRFEHRAPGPATHVAAAALFATYPVWLRLGIVLGRRLNAGRRRAGPG